MRIVLMIAATSLVMSACTFVKMGPGADEVRVLAQGAAPGACEKRGEIDVSVKDRLGPYERDELRVKDELETLARNEAPSVSADTIQPKSAPAKRPRANRAAERLSLAAIERAGQNR